jgi:outer membrane protein
MKNLRYSILLALAALVTCPAAVAPVFAQAPVALPLSLDDAIARALDTGEEVALARSQQAFAEGQITQARAGALPKLDVSGGYTRTLASIFDNISFPMGDNGADEGDPFEGLPFGRRNSWVAALRLTQPLYAGGRVGTALEIAKHVREASALDVIEAEAEVVLQVRTAYFRLRVADDLVAISREARDLASAHLGRVELFRQQGTASDFDVLRARVERDNFEPPIIEAQNARRLAELELKRLINVPAGQPIQITPLEPRSRTSTARRCGRPSTTGRCCDRSTRSLPRARATCASPGRPSCRRSTSSARSPSRRFPSSPSPVPADWRRDWAVSVNVSLPLLDGGRSVGETQQAEAELQQNAPPAGAGPRGPRDRARSGARRVRGARAQIEARRATVDQARRALELAELRFRSGSPRSSRSPTPGCCSSRRRSTKPRRCPPA